LGYDFVIQYKPGTEDILADALSRSFFLALFAPTHPWLAKVVEALQQDEKVRGLYNQCLQGTNTNTTYMVKDSLLFWKRPTCHPC